VELRSTVNGTGITVEIADNDLLVDLLRDRLGLKGTKRSCEVEVCGACTVLVDGKPVSSCMLLASEIDGAEVLTIEGLRDTDFFRAAEESFIRHAAVQCGFCTPGVLLTLSALAEQENSGGLDLKKELSGNLCRCTGYQALLAASGDLLS
jgi:carbon-monoxide dehydrogenase small subunit|tara:strand:+ start:2630 stop:3079 length:450 start_codon:yes stop_codon:yes gene_type:complete